MEGDRSVTDPQTLSAVQQAVVEALGVEPDEVTPESMLMADLGAESIDLLDILFRLERKLGVRIKAADISAHIQGDVPEGEFGDDDGVVTKEGLAQLRRVMPQLEHDPQAATLQAQNVIRLFSVENLADMVQARAAVPPAG
jgi:acyl carrier protein